MSFWSVVVNGSPVDFSTLGLHPSREFSGAGMPPISHNIQSYALQPGALYQSSKVQPRTLALTIDLEGSSYANMHTLRQALINIFAPTTPYYTPEVRIYYSGGTRAVYADFRYLGGLDWVGYTGFNQLVPLQLVATDPHWYEDDAETFSLGGSGSLSDVSYIIKREAGVWDNLEGGTDGAVWAITAGRKGIYNGFYIGGDFTEAGTTDGCDAIFWWDTINGVLPLDGGGIVGETAVSIAIAANGDVWACASDGVHRYNVATDTWDDFAGSDSGYSDTYLIKRYQVVIAPSGTVYVGGSFLNFESGTADDIVSYAGSTWTDIGKPATIDYISAIAVAADGTLYIGGGDIGADSALVYKWNGATWTLLATATGTDHLISEIEIDSSGNLYIGGLFELVNGISAANIARLSGASITALGAGLAAQVTALHWSGGVLYAGTAESATIYKWNGSAWYELAADLAASSTVLAIAALGNVLLAGGDFTGTVTIPASSTITPVSTSPVFPVITLTLASGSAVLASITNETTGHVIYLSYTLAAGETITIDLSPGKKTITSSSAGAIPYAILEGSDLANFCLIGAVENTITVASNNGDVNATLTFQTAHWSIDGSSS